MKRRVIYALAGLALLLSVAAGAVAAVVDGALADGQTNGTISVDSGAAAPLVVADTDNGTINVDSSGGS